MWDTLTVLEGPKSCSAEVILETANCVQNLLMAKAKTIIYQTLAHSNAKHGFHKIR